MIEISAPLPPLKIGFMSLHKIFSDGQHIGYVDLKCIQEGEIETVKKYSKRKLFVGPTYGARIFLDIKETSLTVDKLWKKARAVGYHSRNEKELQMIRKPQHLHAGTDRRWQEDNLQSV